MTEGIQYEHDAGLGALDRALLRGAASHKSPKELSALTQGAVSPAEAAQRVLEILDSRDWLSQVQARMLLIDEMHRLKDVLFAQVEQFRDYAQAQPLVRTLQLIEKTMSADKIDIQKAMEEINKAHARLMLLAISTVLERANLELERRHPDMPGLGRELQEIFHTSYPEVVLQIESRVPASE
jgi:hypothetical protein